MRNGQKFDSVGPTNKFFQRKLHYQFSQIVSQQNKRRKKRKTKYFNKIQIDLEKREMASCVDGNNMSRIKPSDS